MTTPTPSPETALRSAAATVAAQVDLAMRRDLATVLTGCDPRLGEILEHALFSGGKRIRPLLTVLCSRCCGRDDDDLYLLAAAFEYLHVATLIHDDVIDHAPTRRGKKTVHVQFGLASAILAGDWLHARSMHLIGRLTGTQGLEIFCRATESIVNGEFEQLRYIADINTTEAQYFAVIRQKTGNLIASTCAIGALFAGADMARREALTDYGIHIGTAFQVVDDLLDFQGNTETTGKTTGNDFIEGKLTLPLLHTIKRATEHDVQTVQSLFHDDRTRPGAYRQLYSLIDRYHGFTTAAQTAHQLIDQAIASLTPCSTSGTECREITLLKDLAISMLSRKK